MKKVALRIEDSILEETEKLLSRTGIPRNRYINEALDYYNKVQRELLLEKGLKSDSDVVKGDSIEI